MSWGRRKSHSYYGFAPYVPVAERRAKAVKEMDKMKKKGGLVQPVVLQGKKIAATFWGKAWCDNLESYMDFSNRLPRGRSYVRNGSVVHLEIKPGEIEAKVAGSSLYTVKIAIQPAAPAQWKKLCKECAGQIGSLIELLSGKLSDRVMAVMTRKESGLFPSPKEIKLDCSCPDWATMCKHVAAVLYGVGARLDHQPDLLFLLRSVDQSQLVAHAVESDVTAGAGAAAAATLAAADLADVFGIEIAETPPPPAVSKKSARKTAPPTEKQAPAPKKKSVAPKKSAKPPPLPPAPETKKRGRPKGSKDTRPRQARGV